MTRENIIAMAVLSGLGRHLPPEPGLPGVWMGVDLAALERFATLVAANEREACALICVKAMDLIFEYNDELVKQTGKIVCTNLAKAIRKRGRLTPFNLTKEKLT